jgi:hypothetical protein
MWPSCPPVANAIRSRLCCLDRSSVVVIGHLGVSGEREQAGKQDRGADHHARGLAGWLIGGWLRYGA